jgi:DNA-binding transcriptional LysR family regulator
MHPVKNGGITTSYLADEIPELQVLETGTGPPPRRIWIGVHKDMRQTPRTKVVRDALTAKMKLWASRLSPQCASTANGSDPLAL